MTDAAELDVFEATLAAAYPAGGGGTLFSAPLLDVDGITLWVARLDGEPVATALAHHGGRINGVEMISCLPSARGRRVGEAVTWLPTLVVPRPTRGTDRERSSADRSTSGWGSSPCCASPSG